MGMSNSKYMVAGYPFEGNGNDIKGAYNGTVSGATFVAGQSGAAASYDGIDDNTKHKNIIETNGVSLLSVFLTAKMTIQDNRITAFVMKELLGDASSSNRWALCPSQPTIGDSNDILCLLGNGSNSYGYTTNNILPLNEWFRIGFVFDGTKLTNAEKLKVYYNCVQQSLTFSGTIPTTTGTNTAEVICGYYNRYKYFKGLIDNLKIYNKALTRSEIQRDYLNLPIL